MVEPARLGGGMIMDVSERLLGQSVERVENESDTTEADRMSNQEGTRSAGTGDGGEDGGSHMAGGEHMAGGGHMAGGSHMSGGKQMSGSGPLAGGAADGADGAAPASGGATDEGTARSRPGGQRSIDSPGSDHLDPRADSSTGLKGVWPMLAVVIALIVCVVIGYAVWG